MADNGRATAADLDALAGVYEHAAFLAADLPQPAQLIAGILGAGWGRSAARNAACS